ATGILTDARDGKTYKTIVLGEQTWMAQNLAYKAGSGCWAYADNDSNMVKYGYLYNWETSKKVCPRGWHLPSETEFQTLAQFFGGVFNYKIRKSTGSESKAGTKMKSTTGWEGMGNGTDKKGFNALPAGLRLGKGAYKKMGSSSSFWSSSEETGYNADLITAYSLDLISSSGFIAITSLNLRDFGLSVRCMKD
ncbi:MAG: FISUMP domain-containing protein, partial [Bacteroidota bacterium]